MVSTIVSIIAAVINVASATTANVMNIKERERARKEARGIADMNRSNILEQRDFDNRMTSQKLGFNDRQLDHSERMMNEGMKDMEQNKLDLQQNRRKNQFTQSVNRLQEEEHDSFARRGIAQRRFI